MPPTGSGLVSVIVPCFNQGRFLREAVESLFAQTYRNWECIIIDDGSTDDTPRVAADLARRDQRVRCLAQPNRRLPATRNRGLDEAKGDFIQFLDADDVILPQKLHLQVGAHARSPDPAIVYCHYRFGRGDSVYEELEQSTALTSRLDPDRPLEHLARDWETALSIPIHCFLFDVRLFRELGIRFDSALPNHEDWDCWMRMFRRRPSMIYLSEVLAVYRVHADSMTRNGPAMRRGFLRAIKKQQGFFWHDREVSRLLAAKLAATRAYYRDHGPFAGARQTLRGGLRPLKAMISRLVARGARPPR